MKNYIYGYHSIEEELKKGTKGGVLLFSEETGKRGYLKDLAKKKNVPVKRVNEKELDHYCDRKKHRGIILLCEIREEKKEKELKTYDRILEKEDALILILDGITDPHNYGAILRSADQFGVDIVIIPDRKSAKDTRTVSVTSAGASSYIIQVPVPNLSRAIDFLKDKGFWVYGADLHGNPVNHIDLKGKIALVVGSEGKGIRRLVMEKCDVCVMIPTCGHVDSLNVSVATGILLYEIRRQQGLFNN
ncbi:MAG: 23S rRNA (guanosine(2251)-2'-O)-methyltransferase RlmB [Spirochaetales bacterium]|nr:23S rRNA (guanosine(2251)-2'-O)-methyltransferase RlmB [Spirochaetales bacterium]